MYTFCFHWNFMFTFCWSFIILLLKGYGSEHWLRIYCSRGCNVWAIYSEEWRVQLWGGNAGTSDREKSFWQVKSYLRDLNWILWIWSPHQIHSVKFLFLYISIDSTQVVLVDHHLLLPRPFLLWSYPLIYLTFWSHWQLKAKVRAVLGSMGDPAAPWHWCIGQDGWPFLGGAIPC